MVEKRGGGGEKQKIMSEIVENMKDIQLASTIYKVVH